MYSLSALEEVAYCQVEEMRRQVDRARLLRTLPCNETPVRRRMRAFTNLLQRYLPALDVRVFSSGVPGNTDEACWDA
jgi:hypothetical protein